MRVYFDIGEETVDWVVNFFTLLRGYDKEDVKKAIESCEKEPPVITEMKGMDKLMNSQTAAACFAVKSRMNKLFHDKYLLV